MEQTKIQIDMDAIYQDNETGFTGKATAWCQYKHGTDMVHLENEVGDKWVETGRVSKLG